MVDAYLRSSTVQLVQLVLREEYKGKSNDSQEHEAEVAVKEKMKRFYKVLKNVIGKKLMQFTPTELDNLILTSNVLLAEGHGSIEISEPPTAAQGRIIKSLVKVVFHQLAPESDDVHEGHANLLLSLFVKKIYCDLFVETTIAANIYDLNSSLHKNICNIIDTTEDPDDSLKVNRRSDRHDLDKFLVHLFCCLEDVTSRCESGILLEEFDKIDLDNEEVDDQDTDGTTLNSFPKYNEALNQLGMSKQTLSQTKVTLLPSHDFEGLWESLYFDGRIKQRMYSYATIALKVASLSNHIINDENTSGSIFANNKLLIIHGPPGTGKTTICMALCQKLSIRKEYSYEIDPIDAAYKGIIVEISCSRIFSRWFGESSKNLTSIFADVENLLKVNQKSGSFVCLLIDEVEAIAFSRNDLLSKNESTDGVRVVSTLLTQLDRLKKYNNLLILATSNLLDSLDPAFVDRADGVFFIGNPSKHGIVNILASSLNELISRGIISSSSDNPNILESQSYKEIVVELAKKCSVCVVSPICVTILLRKVKTLKQLLLTI